MNITHFVYPFISWWTFGLFLLFAYDKWRFYEHLCTSILWTCIFNPFGYTPRSGISGHMVTLMFKMLRLFSRFCVLLGHVIFSRSALAHHIALLFCVYMFAWISLCGFMMGILSYELTWFMSKDPTNTS